MTSSTAPIICGAVCRNFATGGRTWGILKRGGAQLHAALGGALEDNV